jgi:hypothetical protein
MNILPRWLHRWYATSSGYFWLPCVLCGEFRGGHETPRPFAAVRLPYHSEQQAKLVCRGCAEKYPKTRDFDTPRIEDVLTSDELQLAKAKSIDALRNEKYPIPPDGVHLRWLFLDNHWPEVRP